MGDDWKVKICCMGAGYVGGPTMAVIAKQCPDVSPFLFYFHGEMSARATAVDC